MPSAFLTPTAATEKISPCPVGRPLEDALPGKNNSCDDRSRGIKWIDMIFHCSVHLDMRKSSSHWRLIGRQDGKINKLESIDSEVPKYC